MLYKSLSTLIQSFNATESELLTVSLKNKKGKAIPVTGHGGPYRCEISRLLHFLDNQLTDSVEVCQPYSPAALYPQEDSWYSFLLEAESTPGP
jgi:hypothetical protein